MKLSEYKSNLDTICKEWSVKQLKNKYSDYHLYYIESKPEHDGGLLIAATKPANNNYKVALNNRINKSYTAERLYNSLLPIVSRLPIIE